MQVGSINRINFGVKKVVEIIHLFALLRTDVKTNKKMSSKKYTRMLMEETLQSGF